MFVQVCLFFVIIIGWVGGKGGEHYEVVPELYFNSVMTPVTFCYACAKLFQFVWVASYFSR